jgi:Tfp pilus assembly protein PilO
MKTKIKFTKYMIITTAVWGICAVFIGLGYVVYYQPRKAELAQLEIRFSESQSQLEQARVAAQDESKEKLQQRWEQSHRLINSFLAQEETVTGVVFEIGQIANELRLAEFSSKNQSQASHSTVEDCKSLSEAWLNVEFQASFGQFSEFINRLERNCPVIFIEEVTLRRGTGSAKGHPATLKLSFLAKTDAKHKTFASMAGRRGY